MKKKMNSVNGLSLSMVKGAIVTEVMLPGVTAASEGEFTLPHGGSQWERHSFRGGS